MSGYPEGGARTSFCTNSPAILALDKVEMAPVMSAEKATRETSADLPGEIWDKTPICVPSDPIFANPHSAYVAMIVDRGESPAYAGSVVSSKKATNSFCIICQHDAHESEVRWSVRQ